MENTFNYNGYVILKDPDEPEQSRADCARPMTMIRINSTYHNEQRVFVKKLK